MGLLDHLPESMRSGHPKAQVRWITVAVVLVVGARIVYTIVR